MARGLKNKGRKTPPQLRVKATLPLMEQYEETARRFGYAETGPFVRRLMDAARQGDAKNGIIHFFLGNDGLGVPGRAA